MLKRLKQLPFTPLQIAIHLYAWLGLAKLFLDFFTDNLTANPIQALEQRTGRTALALLIMSLACSPLNNVFGWRELIKRRRALGLYALMYATIHVIIFVDLDFGLAWSLLIQTVIEKQYIIVGVISFLMLVPLGITSFDVWKTRLGKNWKRLHQTIYFIAPLATLHYAWAKKGDLFRLQGDIIRPLTYILLIIILLILRLRLVRRFLASLRTRILLPFSRPHPQPRVDAEM